MSANDIRLEALLNQEDNYKVRDYLCCKGSKSDVNVECRSCMASWTYQMIEFCNFHVETALCALSYLDRICSSEKLGPSLLKDRRQFQLCCMCSLMIAVKLHESTKLDVMLLSELSKGSFRPQEIIDMEMKILFALKWRLSPPTAFDFLECYLNQMTNNRMLRKIARLQIEASSKDYKFATYKASNIALAALRNAMETLDLHDDLQVDNSSIIRNLRNGLLITMQSSFPEINIIHVQKDSYSQERYGQAVAQTNTPKSPTSVRNWS